MHACGWKMPCSHAPSLHSHSACSVLPGTLVPSATKAMALTESFKKMKQPRCPAMSPMSAVLPPIMRMLITKVG